VNSENGFLCSRIGQVDDCAVLIVADVLRREGISAQLAPNRPIENDNAWPICLCYIENVSKARLDYAVRKISKKAPAARLIVCPYQARAHPLVSAHEGFGSLTIEKNIVLAAAAVDRLLARPQCVELIKLVRMRTGGSELSGGLRRLLEVGMCLARRAAFSW
jgi:hypothetical protein